MVYLSQLELRGKPVVTATSLDFNTRLVKVISDDAPEKFYIYRRNLKKASYLFSTNEALKKYKHAQMIPIQVKTRDRFNQVCYLTIPLQYRPRFSTARLTTVPLPMVLNVHGGPWSHDSWGFRGDVQLLANRGYAVMQCNFRASVGYGKRWLNAGNGEWGRNMQYDLLDAVEWAVGQRIADPNRVAIVGASCVAVASYATLVGLAFTPDIFACGVDLIGVSNLVTFIKTIPPYWQTMYKMLVRRIGGDPNTPEGVRFLRSRSPYYFARNIKKPLLIAQGANDPRVNRNESDSIVRVMKKYNIPVTYIVFPDEGHGFIRAENRLAVSSLSEQFLQSYIGGLAEPDGRDVKQSVVHVALSGGDLCLYCGVTSSSITLLARLAWPIKSLLQ